MNTFISQPSQGDLIEFGVFLESKDNVCIYYLLGPLQSIPVNSSVGKNPGPWDPEGEVLGSLTKYVDLA